MLKKVVPTRLAKGQFADLVAEAEGRGASKEELSELLGYGRAKLGMRDGNLEEGELEIGHVVASISEIRPVRTIMHDLVKETKEILRELSKYSY